MLKRSKSFFEQYQVIKLDNKSQVIFNEFVEFNINREEKILKIKQINNKGRAIIYKSNLDSWIIEMKNLNNDNVESPNLNYKNLTGCLTIIDSQLKDVEIYAQNLLCEDSINFIRSTGSIKKVSIIDSLSDGLDADFSEINFKEIYVDKTGNDCADFSFGNYKINNAELANCGDKALSVGEKSFVQLNTISVENSNTGVASKDSSITKLKNAYLKNLKTCISAYKKKQEFNGGLIEINNIKCQNSFNKLDKDSSSKIIIKNEL